jgi:hypothetical protein
MARTEKDMLTAAGAVAVTVAGKDGGRAVGYTVPLVGGIGGLTYPIADLGLKMAVVGGSAGGLASSPGCVAHGGGVAAPFKSAAGGTGLALGGGGQGSTKATKASAATAGEDVDSNAGGGGGFGRIVIRTRAAASLNGTISPDPTLRTDL